HVVCPDTQAYETDANRGPDHDGVSENRLAGKYRNNFRGERKAGNNKDIDFGVPEDPEEMHPECRRPARLRIKEMTAEIAVDKQHDLRRRQWSHGDENHRAH